MDSIESNIDAAQNSSVNYRLKYYSNILSMVAKFLESIDSKNELCEDLCHISNKYSEYKILRDIDFLSIVRFEIRKIKIKRSMFPKIVCSDPAWDILLDLFEAKLIGRIVSIKSACLASGVPMTTALRYLDILVGEGYVERSIDPGDGRRVLVSLSQKGFEKMTGFLR